MTAPHARCQILVVEDDTDIRECLGEILVDAGYEPVTATDGADALAQLRSGSVRPCLIILDLMMPVVDGREFREIQVRDEALSAIPVVLLTAHAKPVEVAQSMGNIDMLQKPVDLDRLLESVASLCAGHVGAGAGG